MTQNAKRLDLRREYLAQLLILRNHQYRETKEERRQLFEDEIEEEQEFPVWAELELLSSDVVGYASQIVEKGQVSSPQQALEVLNRYYILDKRKLIDWYLTTNETTCPNMKQFLITLDYIRLITVEYILMTLETG